MVPKYNLSQVLTQILWDTLEIKQTFLDTVTVPSTPRSCAVRMPEIRVCLRTSKQTNKQNLLLPCLHCRICSVEDATHRNTLLKYWWRTYALVAESRSQGQSKTADVILIIGLFLNLKSTLLLDYFKSGSRLTVFFHNNSCLIYHCTLLFKTTAFDKSIVSNGDWYFTLQRT